MSIKKIHNIPCEVGPCPNFDRCRTGALECKAVKQYYSKGWFMTNLVGVRLTPMKMRY